MTLLYKLSLGLLAVCGLGLLAMGCDGTTHLVPNSDPNLNKPATSFAADSARRTYEASAPKSQDQIARASYELGFKQFDMVNLLDQDQNNLEVWVNHQYVVFVPHMEKKAGKTLNFQMFFDNDGHHFDTDGGKNAVKSLEIYRDGTMYEVPNHVAD